MNFSLVTSAFDTLRLDLPSELVLLEARMLQSAHVPPYSPNMPALIIGVDSPQLALQVKTVLLAVYPREHSVYVVDPAGKKEESLETLGFENPSAEACIYLPALAEGTGFEDFQEIVAHLRAPDGCPWDREQTHTSLRTHLLEETYETLAAIDNGDAAAMREEFGDLLLQIMLNSQIASETGAFNVNEVVKGIYDKIIRRHPHVFGDVQIKSTDGVLQNWEKLKEQERKDKKEEKKGLLDGVPTILPALIQAQEYQTRAARVGFDWPEIEGVLEKVAEEIQEVKEANGPDHLAEELGDLIFALVNLARWKKVDAESALRGTNLKFKNRFAYIEAGAKRQGRNLSDLSLDEMEALWQEAKGQ